MGVQSIQLLKNVVLTLLKLIQQLTWFDIRDLRCLCWRHICFAGWPKSCLKNAPFRVGDSRQLEHALMDS